MPRSYRLAFREAIRPDVNPVTRFGGQPAWLEEPVTPLSRRTGKPMTFICQIEVPADWHAKGPARMAYVFMTGGGFDYDAVETWNPDDGETAVIVQKALAAHPAAEPYPDTLKRWEEVDGKRTAIPHEYAVEQTPVEDSSYPFNLNLGGGVGYVFLDVACTEGKLLWQSERLGSTESPHMPGPYRSQLKESPWKK